MPWISLLFTVYNLRGRLSSRPVSLREYAKPCSADSAVGVIIVLVCYITASPGSVTDTEYQGISKYGYRSRYSEYRQKIPK